MAHLRHSIFNNDSKVAKIFSSFHRAAATSSNQTNLANAWTVVRPLSAGFWCSMIANYLLWLLSFVLVTSNTLLLVRTGRESTPNLFI